MKPSTLARRIQQHADTHRRLWSGAAAETAAFLQAENRQVDAADLVLTSERKENSDLYTVNKAVFREEREGRNGDAEKAPIIILSAGSPQANHTTVSLYAPRGATEGLESQLVRAYEPLWSNFQQALAGYRSTLQSRVIQGYPTHQAVEEMVQHRRYFTSAPIGDEDTLVSLFMDLNKFKPANDKCGHNKGDDLLVAVGEILADHLPTLDAKVAAIGHRGGDEFVGAAIGSSPAAVQAYIADVTHEVSKQRLPIMHRKIQEEGRRTHQVSLAIGKYTSTLQGWNHANFHQRYAAAVEQAEQDQYRIKESR